MRAIIIDDERLARRELNNLLENYPEIEIIDEAVNADDAVEKINRLEPDLIFLDIMMPEMDGFDRHSPEHVAPLVVYLASSLCRFTGRVFAIEGPDVAIYRSFSVEQDWSTQGAWTSEALAEAFASINERTDTRAFFPGGVVPQSVPPGRTLKTVSDPQAN